jgi:hypothetical protein
MKCSPSSATTGLTTMKEIPIVASGISGVTGDR